LHKKGFRKQINNGVLKEVEKASDVMNQDVERRLRERVRMIEKRSEWMFRKNSDLTRIRK
jgi:hypothetical protein